MKTGSITYNGKNSLELGVYTTGSGSFDAAELDVDKYEVAGRNGDVIIPKNRYKNIEVIYPAFIPKQFGDKVQSVRNWLRSAKVYARLEDTYDMDHFRLGIPSGVQSFEPVNRNDGANFEMTFDCKPQRFLKVGETPETVEPDVQTESGEIVTFETVAESPMTSAEVSLSPQQDLNGYDSPWPGGGGKNLLKTNDFADYTNNGVTWHRNDDGSVVLNGTATARSYKYLNGGYYLKLEPGTYTASVSGLESGGPFGNIAYSTTENGTYAGTFGTLGGTISKRTFTVENTIYLGLLIDVPSGATNSNRLIKIQIEEGSTATEWSPYSNICHISGHSGAELYVAAEYDADDKTTYSVTFTDQGTVYGGTYDWVSGKLTVDRGIITDFSSLSATAGLRPDGTYLWSLHASNVFSGASQKSISSFARYRRDFNYGGIRFFGYTNDTIYIALYNNDRSEALALLNGQQIVYELATPIEYTLSAQQVETLLGENNVWSDAGEITVEYAEPYNVENPTIFEARPLFIITNPNQGDALSVSGKTITFVESYTGTVTIDCETMDCYAGFSNMNYLITATDFPVLGEGTSIVTWSGSGECKMIPRWWEL